jgi:hypothetical protein
VRGPRWTTFGLAGLAALQLACGAEEAPKPSGRPLVAQPAAEDRADNHPPVIESLRITPEDPVAGLPLRANVRVSDPDGDSVRLHHTWTQNGRPLALSGSTITLASTRKDDRIAVEVTATDGRLESAPARSSVRVRNRAPALIGVGLEPSGTIDLGAELRAFPDALDADGDPVQFRYEWWVNGRKQSTTEKTFSTSGLRRGDTIQARVVATDGEDESGLVASPEARVGNTPPEILSQPPSVDSDGVFRYALEAQDPDGDRNLRYRLLQGPEGLTVDPILGEVLWKPDRSQVGRHEIEVAVEDSHGAGAAQRFYVTVREVLGEGETPAAPAAEEAGSSAR